MPKHVDELTAIAVAAEVRKGAPDGKRRMVAVGGVPGLYIQIGAGTASWILKTMTPAGRREFGLGSFAKIGLAAAREEARKKLDLIRQGIDPVQQRREQREAVAVERRQAVSFDKAAEAYIEDNEKHWSSGVAADARSAIARLASPKIGSKRVADITSADVLSVLTPIWSEKRNTASKLRGLIERVLDAAGTKGWRPKGDNPAAWRGNLQHVLGATGRKARAAAKVEPHPSMPWPEVPAFWKPIPGTVAGKALRLIILTALRSAEARALRWEEVDLDAGLLRIGEERMKAGREHVVALSGPVIELLQSMPRTDEFVFESRKGKPVSDTAVRSLVPPGASVHGFRTSFRTWATAHGADGDLAEWTLAHAVGDATRRAYDREPPTERMRELLTGWAVHVTGKSS